MIEKLPEQEIAKVMAWLSEKMRCPLCNFQYNLDQTKIIPSIGLNTPSTLVHVDCGECRSSIVFALDVRGGEVFLVGVVTDLVYEEIPKFLNKEPLQADDLLDWHKYWSGFNSQQTV